MVDIPVSSGDYWEIRGWTVPDAAIESVRRLSAERHKRLKREELEKYPRDFIKNVGKYLGKPSEVEIQHLPPYSPFLLLIKCKRWYRFLKGLYWLSTFGKHLGNVLLHEIKTISEFKWIDQGPLLGLIPLLSNSNKEI